MANTIITSTANSIKVVFNDDSAKVEMTKGTWRKADIRAIELYASNVNVRTFDGGDLAVHNSSSVFLIVDTVDGASPSSLSDLYDKLIALIA